MKPSFAKRALFYLVLLTFSVLSHFALGTLSHYIDFIGSYFALFGFLLALRCLNQKIFLFCTALLFLISIIYLPSGLLYGPISIGVAASVYETNPSEALGYFKAIPLSTYSFAALYVASFITVLWLNKKTHLQNFAKTDRALLAASPYKKTAYLYLIALLAYCFYNPIWQQQNNKEPFSVSTFLTRSSFYPISFIANGIKVNNTYFAQKAMFNEALHAQPQWQIENVEPKYQNYVMIIGESMRRDYTSLYGYPEPTTPFLESVKGVIFDLYVAAGPNTQPSLQRSLYRSENNHETTVYTDNVISLAKAAHFKTYWLSNQGRMGEYDTMASRIGVQADYAFFTKKGGYTFGNPPDAELLPELEKALQAPSDTPKLIVLHLMGSHPPFCDRVNQPTRFHLISDEMSCYLDSLKQTDDLLASIQNLLQQQNQPYSVIYFSDHGLAHLGEGKDLTMLNNKEFKQSYAVPFVKFSSDDREHRIIKNPQSAFNFMDGFAQWLGIRENHLSQQDFFNPPANQPIKVFNWYGLVDYQGLKEDPAKVHSPEKQN